MCGGVDPPPALGAGPALVTKDMGGARTRALPPVWKMAGCRKAWATLAIRVGTVRDISSS